MLDTAGFECCTAADIRKLRRIRKEKVAGVTGLEPATSGVTGQRSNQLSYTPTKKCIFYLRVNLT